MKTIKHYIKTEAAAHAGDTVGALSNDVMNEFANVFAQFLAELEKRPHVNPTEPLNVEKARADILEKLRTNRQLKKDLRVAIWSNFHDWEYLYGKEVYPT
jgi:hypothetical protein